MTTYKAYAVIGEAGTPYSVFTSAGGGGVTASYFLQGSDGSLASGGVTYTFTPGDSAQDVRDGLTDAVVADVLAHSSVTIASRDVIFLPS
jgi:hypothetical protein